MFRLPHAGCLTTEVYFPTILKDGEFKVKVLVDLVPWWGPPSGLLMTAFLLCLHMAERQDLSLLMFIKSQIPSQGPHPNDFI